MQRQLNTENERPTNLLKYAERCQQVYQGLKDVARVLAAAKQYKEKRASSNNTPAAKKVATNITTTQTMSSTEPNCRLSISKRDRLMKEARCFTCKQVGHRTTKCSNDWKPMSSLGVSHMVVQEVQELPAGNTEPLLKS